jgi:hypothetical protein
MGADPEGAIISAYEDEGLTHIFWWAGIFSLVAAVGAVLSVVEPGWIDLAVGSQDSLRGAEWMVAGAHVVVAVFLAAVAWLEWRSAFPRHKPTDRRIPE